MKKIGLVLTMVLSASSFAASVGLSTHPFSQDDRLITTEFNSYMSNGAGLGITAKYYQKIDSKMNFDAGFGFSNGDRANMLMAGLDYEIFPDYSNQPRFSVKGLFESTGFDGDRINAIGASPTISKGFSFWGKEAFPFLALPVKLNLNDDQGTYESSMALATGITGHLPIDGMEKFIGNIEANIDLRNSYTALVLGVSLPL